VVLVAQGHPAELHLSGERDASFLGPTIERLRLADRVVCHPYLTPAQLANLLQSVDVFVIPSHQEGLCIAALEAMACGVPVVSTRCGGPEDFVLEGQTGSLVDSDPQALAAAIVRICSDRLLQQRLSAGACHWVETMASPAAGRATFRRHLEAVVNDR
jgi:glycosyltransferase involved in cell wall biosynthesis